MYRVFVSWVFFIYLVTSGILWSIVVLPVFPFAGRNGRYWLAKLWCHAVLVVLRRVIGLSSSVEGIEFLPKGAFILLSRHESTWETLAYMALFPRRLNFAFKKELQLIPFFGWVLRRLDMVSIDRGSPRRAHKALTRECVTRLEKGDVVVIFPEGTRVKPGAPVKLTSGAARLACATHVPVVAVVHNAGTFWPAKGWPYRRGHIRVVITPPLNPDGTTPQELNQLVQNRMEAAMASLS